MSQAPTQLQILSAPSGVVSNHAVHHVPVLDAISLEERMHKIGPSNYRGYDKKF